MAEPLERLTAALANRYRIERELGAGGMATVYLAHDLKHDREVAIKVLRPELAAVIGGERFVQEIKTTAHLQHPHILPLFDSGTADGFMFYVMPFIDGETLRGKLNRENQLNIEEAVRITQEVADALGYAHQQGVIHRDIKPENILLEKGHAVVADFGIALAVSAAAGGRMTETGLSLGTPHYMSPEQATAEKELSARSDIYSLGSVLHEMLTGEPPHTGETAQAVIMKIVAEEVQPVTRMRKSIPANVAAAVAKAVERLPADRFISAQDFAHALGDPAFRHGADAASGEAVRASRGWRGALTLGAAVGLAVGIYGTWMLVGRTERGRIETIPTVRFTIDLPPEATLSPNTMSNVAISQDGTRLIYVADTEDGTALYLHNMAQTGFSRIRGTEGALGPFFSPDANSVGFFASGKLRKVPLSGGAPVDLADAALPRGGYWAPGGTILFTSAPGSGLWSVPDTGGTPIMVTHLDSTQGERTHRFPVVDDHGRILATTRTGTHSSFDQAAITLFDPSTLTRRELVSGGSHPQLLAGDVLVLARASTLYGVRLSEDHSRRVGEPVVLIDSVMNDPSTGAAQYAVSNNGTLVYAGGMQWQASRTLEWIQGGRTIVLIGEARPFSGPRVSPDGSKLAVTIEGANDDIWIYDLAAGGASRLTFEAGSNIAPLWDPSGQRLVFSSNRSGRYNLYLRGADGSGQPQRLTQSDDVQFPSGWTPDGSVIAYSTITTVSGYDIWICNLAEGTSHPFLASPFNEYGAVFSPDGQWVAYVSDETGQDEVYLRPYPNGQGQQQVSAGGGTNPVWDQGGRQLFYRQGLDLVAVDATAGAVVPASRRVVATVVIPRGSVTSIPSFDVHPRGGVIVARRSKRGFPNRLAVVTGWLTEVGKRLP